MLVKFETDDVHRGMNDDLDGSVAVDKVDSGTNAALVLGLIPKFWRR